MTHEIIATGSTGNAVLLNGSFLVDCGVPYRKLEPWVKGITHVFLTHEHGDHFKPRTARELHEQRPGVRWVCCSWMVTPLLGAGVSATAIDVAPLEQWTGYGDGLFAMPVEIPHNVPNCGWRFVLPGGERVFYATDCGSLDAVEAPGCEYYFVEANHTEADILRRMEGKIAEGAYSYELAAMKNHLSREKADAWLEKNKGPRSVVVYLHQHVERKRRDGHKET